MVATSKYTDAEKRAFVDLALKESRKAAAKKAGVTPRAISHWAKALGVSLMPGANKTPPKAPGASTAVARVNERLAEIDRAERGPTSASGELALARLEIESALARLAKVEAALRQITG